MKKLLLLAGTAIALMATPALATTTTGYLWITTSDNTSELENGFNLNTSGWPHDLVVASGTTSLDFALSQCDPWLGCISTSGSTAGLISAFGEYGEDPQAGSLAMDVLFNGTTVDGSISLAGGYTTFIATGSGYNWSGTVSSDFIYGCYPSCHITGYFLASVPEPSSLVLLGSVGPFMFWRRGYSIAKPTLSRVSS